MATPERIPTPIKQRWRTVRYQFLPLVVFALAVVASAVLWRRHVGTSQVVGEVVTREVAVGARVDGVLKAGDKPLEPFMTVTAGEVIATIDDEPTLRALATLRATHAQLMAQLDEVTDTVRTENASLQTDIQRAQLDKYIELKRREAQRDRLRLEILQRRSQIATDRVLRQRYNAQFEYQSDLVHRGLAGQQDMIDARFQRDEADQRIAQNEKVQREAMEQFTKLDKELKQIGEGMVDEMKIPEPVKADLDKRLAPIHKEIAVQQRRIEELELRLDALQIRAPFAGKVVAVHAWPGQAVQAGDLVATIAATRGSFIVAYIRQNQRIRPAVGDLVSVRVRSFPSQSDDGHVVEVGAQYQPVPTQQLRDVTVPEWGLPVRIAIPAALGASLRPGELVDLHFDESRKASGDGMSMLDVSRNLVGMVLSPATTSLGVGR